MPGRQQSTGTWSNKAVQHECEQINLFKGGKGKSDDVSLGSLQPNIGCYELFLV